MLTQSEILNVEEQILADKKKNWVYLTEVVADMSNSIGTRWQKALQENDALPHLEAMNDAIIEYSKATGEYGEYIRKAEEGKAEELERVDRYRRAI